MFAGVKLQRPSLQQRACKLISKFLYKIDSWDQSNLFFSKLQFTYSFCKLYRFMFVGVKLKRPSLQQRASKFTS